MAPLVGKLILVTGATGKQGGAVIKALLARPEDYSILAVTRDPARTASQKLKASHPRISLVKGDLDDVPALFKETMRITKQKPIWGVYSVQVSMGRGVTSEGEVKQGQALIDESIKAGVQHFVYSSVERGGDEASWDNPTPIPHFQTKHTIENYLRDVTRPGTPGEKMGWTILRPVAFMENLVPGFATKVFVSALRNELKGKRVQWVATSDIGVFAAKAFTNPEQWNRRAVGLAGDELNFDEMNSTFDVMTGQPAPITFAFMGNVLTGLATELATMIRWFASDGYHANIEARRAEHPGMLTMGQWLIRDSKFELASK